MAVSMDGIYKYLGDIINMVLPVIVNPLHILVCSPLLAPLKYYKIILDSMYVTCCPAVCHLNVTLAF
jgi:hypothetical protein